jgi:hypothetical protein
LIAVGLVAGDLNADDKVGEFPYYPAKVGTTWHYRIGQKKVTVKVAKHEKQGAHQCARVETTIDGEVKAFEHIAVSKEGLLRVAYNGEAVTPPLLMLKFPPTPGDSWPVNSKSGGDAAKGASVEVVKGTYTASKEKITVPAGDFEAIKVRGNLDVVVGGTTTTGTFTCWYAEGKGIVKTEIAYSGSQFSLELEKFEEGS